ncbi:MAG: hypothetical protein DRR15_01820 [Gammaproteobacteria bacterium]|nr:MAG: hypothetical protein DRR15_01820 [Gammaproteobacteria bacterium]
MKYVISLLLGALLGALLFSLALYYNPFAAQPTISPLSVTQDRVINLSYSAVASDAILYTDDGESIIATRPDRVADLWELAIVDTRIFVTTLRSARGEVVGIGFKMSSDSEQTSLINANAEVNSVWHVYLPGQGTFLIDQSENYWSYIHDIVIPARWSSGDNWKGSFHNITTSGPGALGIARVTGGSGEYAGQSTEAVESLTASAYSALDGPVSMNGSLTIVAPVAAANSE